MPTGKREIEPEPPAKELPLRGPVPEEASFLRRLKDRKILQSVAAFVGIGWLIYEMVHWILVEHFHFPEGWLDFTLVTLLGALFSLVVWLWFRGRPKKPRGVKVEVLVVPLIILLTLAIAANLIFHISGISARATHIGAVALGLGVAWIVFKSLQWAVRMPAAPGDNDRDIIPSEPKPGKSIAVLPFKNISPEDGQDYFSDGITDEVISDLSRIHALRVISRSSSMTYKGSTKTVPEIAGELGVRYVLEGSVRKAGNNLKITAQLIEASRDMHLWTEKYDGTLDDIFKIQERVSRAIVTALEQKLAPDEEKTLSDRPIQNLRAYESYLMARREMYQCSEESMERALKSLAHAVEIYGESSLLYAAMGLVHLQLYNMGFRTTEETLKKAERLLHKIIGLEPESSYRYHLMGTIERYRGLPQKAVRSLKKAIDLDPNDPDTLGLLGSELSLCMGKPDLAKPYIRRLIEIDPLVAWNYNVAAVYYLAKGKADRALAMIRRAVQMDPKDRNFRFWESLFLAWNDRTMEAIDLSGRIVNEKADDLVAILSFSLRCALQDEKDKALQALTKPKREILWNDPEGPWLMASCFARLDNKDEAFSWLERAVARGWTNFPLFSRIDPFLANIRSEERFRKLMERVRRNWENVAI